ncbi:cytochrome b-c1 complex subunit 2, mitochondrial [Leptopilina boulardi]|uniref:cytochrome b-c1 complex subunit 2, mitochondrial n=1 Tax=Leptopilina boulardi TaxID=63433 RepID=UPI0021F5068A|nr:cytochrome b-c1 complex subunit 2, mitochondrial [Leptopilina boulardi]
MACSAVRSPILRNSSVRHYALAATAQASLPSPDVQVLGNKITVAAVDSNSPVTQVSIVFKAGSRNETYDTQGMSHLLRIAAGLTTSRSTTFGITRNIQQMGANITASADRETIAYTVQVLRDKVNQALPFLEDVATRQVFKPWEISDSSPRLRYEISTVPEECRIVELLHKAAYRTGLGFSLYSPKRQIGEISTETLQHYVSTWFSGSRCAVVGTGISATELSDFASKLHVSSNDCKTEAAKYYGGDARKERNSPIASVAVAFESAGLEKGNEAIAFAILKAAAGSGPCVKWGNGASPLIKAITSATGNEPVAATAFNASYADSGLFGCILQTTPEVAGQATKAAFKWLRTANISDTDVARGKAALKAAVLGATECGETQLENLSQQVLLRGKVLSPLELAAEVDKVSAADVKNAAKKLSSARPTVAAIGNIKTVPYSDQL